jgi:hypothetical protein
MRFPKEFPHDPKIRARMTGAGVIEEFGSPRVAEQPMQPAKVAFGKKSPDSDPEPPRLAFQLPPLATRIPPFQIALQLAASGTCESLSVGRTDITLSRSGFLPTCYLSSSNL